MSKLLTIALVIVSLAASLCPAGEIGYVEDFALAKDRAEALKQLIPGTDNYYYPGFPRWRCARDHRGAFTVIVSDTAR